jgi:hypothetical protein
MIEFGVGRAYVAGDIQIEGEPNISLYLTTGKCACSTEASNFCDCIRVAINRDARAIGDDYDRGDNLYLKFINQPRS